MMRDPAWGWVHYTCVNWTDEIWFKDETKTSIEGTPKIERFKLTCTICRLSKYSGSCLECDYQMCKQAYHVRCAISKGLISDWENMNE